MIRYVFNPFTGNLDAVDGPEYIFEATCDTSNAVGDLVYLIGTRDVRKADIDDRSKTPARGIIVDKITATSCLVQTSGEVSMSGLVVGATYFVGVDGRPSAVPPPRPVLGLRAVQVIGTAVDSSTLILSLTNDLTRMNAA